MLYDLEIHFKSSTVLNGESTHFLTLLRLAKVLYRDGEKITEVDKFDDFAGPLSADGMLTFITEANQGISVHASELRYLKFAPHQDSDAHE